ncbi:MAG: hypothetical protein A2293_09680 [Elusimicrobia bacterium RIFOXYB2_FULL_49_7]|nr:MAG: hypothetical protein A2293_09680 [Elusimicrobia bacterium RIFOXYB2_FULL_49_7]
MRTPETDRKPTVLVADKDGEFVNRFKIKLVALQVEVVSFTSGQRLLDEARRLQPKLIILNTALNDLDGLSVIDRIREGKWSDVPVVVILENDSENLQEQAVRKQVLCRMEPPVDLNALRDVVVRVLNMQVEKANGY